MSLTVWKVKMTAGILYFMLHKQVVFYHWHDAPMKKSEEVQMVEKEKHKIDSGNSIILASSIVELIFAFVKKSFSNRF
jgi:hypothetical protein